MQSWRNRDADFREVAQGSAFAFSVRVLAAGSAFAMNVVITRLLGAGEAGLFFLAYTLVIIASTLSRLGLDQTVVRLNARFEFGSDWGRIKGLYRTGVLWTAGSAVSIAAVLWLCARLLADSVFQEAGLAEVIRVLVVAVPLTALFTLHASALQGVKRIVRSMLVLSVVAPVSLVLLALLLRPESAASASRLYVCAAATALVVGVVWWHRLSPRGVARVHVDTGTILSSCLPLFAVALLSLIIAWSPQLMLGAWSTSADVALFSAAQRTAALTSFVLVAVNTIAAPKFAAMYSAQQNEALGRTARHATRIMVLLGIPPLVVMLAFPDFVLGLFGPEFRAASRALQILALGQFVNVASGSVGYLLAMTGHERVLRNTAFGAAVTCVVFGVLLVPRYGPPGAAVATASGVMLQNLLCVWQARRLLNINTMALWNFR